MNEVAFWGGLAVLLVLCYNQIWPEPLAALFGARKQSSYARLREHYRLFMPLEEAAREAHENASDFVQGFARMDDPSPSAVLQWWAYRIHSCGVPIFGTRPPSSKVEVIPDDELRRGNFQSGAQWLSLGGDDAFVGLVVRRTDFSEARAKIVGFEAQSIASRTSKVDR